MINKSDLEDIANLIELDEEFGINYKGKNHDELRSFRKYLKDKREEDIIIPGTPPELMPQIEFSNQKIKDQGELYFTNNDFDNVLEENLINNEKYTPKKLEIVNRIKGFENFRSDKNVLKRKEEKPLLLTKEQEDQKRLILIRKGEFNLNPKELEDFFK